MTSIVTDPHPYVYPVPPTRYQQGTRTLDEMAANARQLSYQENYSFTEGWDDNTVAEIFNLALNRIYDKITQINQVANIEEYTIDSQSGVQSYPIPQDVKMAIQIMNVRYLYGPQTWQFVTLEQGMIQDRFSYPTNIPNTYCIRNGYILLSPTPNISRPQALIINYQKRMRRLDYRRGKVSGIISPYGNITNISNATLAEVTTDTAHGLSTGDKVGLGGVFDLYLVNGYTFIVTVTSTTTFTIPVDTTDSNIYQGVGIWYKNPVQFQLNFQVDSQKDANLQANGESILDKIQFCGFTDVNGFPVIDAIPINNYDFSTFVITCNANYVIPYAQWLVFQALLANQDTFYVVAGDYSSTHSQLDRQAEDLLIEYAVLRLLRLQSAAEPTQDQRIAENDVLERLSIAYRRYRPSIVPIIFQQRLRTKAWGWGGRGTY